MSLKQNWNPLPIGTIIEDGDARLFDRWRLVSVRRTDRYDATDPRLIGTAVTESDRVYRWGYLE